MQPADRAALYSLKPTVGLVSASGIIPISQLCDSAGPLAKSPADVAALLDVLAEGAAGRYSEAANRSWTGLRIGALDPGTWLMHRDSRKPEVARYMVSSTLSSMAAIH